MLKSVCVFFIRTKVQEMEKFLVGNKTCTTCGNSLQLDEDFCGNCGTPTSLKVNTTIHSLSPNSRQKSHTQTQLGTSKTNPYKTVLAPTQPVLSSTKPTAKKSKQTIKVPTYIPTRNTPPITNTSTGRKLWIFLSPKLPSIIIVAFFVVLFGGMIISNINQTTAAYTLSNYCDALSQRNYDIASNDIENRLTLKSDVSKDQLKTRVEIDANPRGGIGRCEVSSVNETGTLAIGTTTYTYGNGATSTRTYRLFKDFTINKASGNWEVDTSYWQNSNQQY